MIDFSDTNQISELFQQAVEQAIEEHSQKEESVAISDEFGNVKVILASDILDFECDRRFSNTDKNLNPQEINTNPQNRFNNL